MQAVLAQRGVVSVDRHLVEEGVDRRAQLGERAHRTGEVFDVERGDGVGLHLENRRGERLLLVGLQQRGVDVTGVARLVLLLLDGEDVLCALDAGQQVSAVVGLQELGQSLDALDDEGEVVLAGQREDGVDQVMPRALVPQVDLQPLGEEPEEIDDLSMNLLSVPVDDAYATYLD